MANTKVPAELSSTPSIVDNGNATAITIDSSENVGIGTSSPVGTASNYNSAALHIHQSQSGSYGSQLHLTNAATGGAAGNGAFISMWSDDDLYITNQESDGMIKFASGGNADALVIDDSGNVGIGTTSMNAPLEVSGGVSMTGGWGRSLLLRHPFPMMVFQSEYSTDAYAGIGYDNTSGLNFMVNSPTIDLFANSQSPAMMISNNKNVGIGTTSPNATLSLGKATGARRFLIYDGGGSNNLYAGFAIDSPSGNDFTMYAHNSGVLKFGKMSTDGSTITPHMTINAGSIHIGTTSEATGSTGGASFSADSNNRRNLICATTGTGSLELIEFRNPNGTVGTIKTSGSSTSYNTSSDYRLKENVDYEFNALDRVAQLKPARFNFIADADTTVDGFLAHEVQDIVPEAITGEKDAVREEEYEVTPAVLDDDGNVVTEAEMGTREVPEYQGIDQSKLVPLLTKAIQEQQELINNLTARIEQLEN